MGLHTYENAPLNTLVVMRVDKERSWELGCYSQTKNATGFDPQAHAAEVAMWMDVYSETKIQRINGRIALSSTAEPDPPKSANRPSKRSREAAKRRALNPAHVEVVAPAPVASHSATQPMPQAPVPTIPRLVEPPTLVNPVDLVDESQPKPEPIRPVDLDAEIEDFDNFKKRWHRVNAEAAEREAALADSDKTFILPTIPAVAEPPVAPRPALGVAKVKMKPNTTDQTEQWERPPGLRG